MDNDQINYITHRLQRYEESIRETGDHFNELESFGCYRACAPCYEKFGIPLLIDALKTDSDICDTLWQEYDRITSKLNTFDTLKGSIYRDLLFNDLQKYVAAYHSALCYADLDMISVESDHDLFNREAIRALLAELRDYDTIEIEYLVTTLDELYLHMSKPLDGTSLKKPQVFTNSKYTPLMARGERYYTERENGQTRNV